MSVETVTHKKVTLKIPSELYLSLMKLVIHKHRGIYGHFNRECVAALENHLNRESQKIEQTIIMS